MRIEENPNALVAHLTNTRILDDLQIGKIGDEIDELVNNVAGSKRLILDFSDVEFMSSAMIGRLILVNQAAKAANLDLRLRNICPPMMKVFKLMRLNKLFKIGERNDGEQDALEPIVSPFSSQNLTERGVGVIPPHSGVCRYVPENLS